MSRRRRAESSLPTEGVGTGDRRRIPGFKFADAEGQPGLARRDVTWSPRPSLLGQELPGVRFAQSSMEAGGDGKRLPGSSESAASIRWPHWPPAMSAPSTPS